MIEEIWTNYVEVFFFCIGFSALVFWSLRALSPRPLGRQVAPVRSEKTRSRQ